MTYLSPGVYIEEVPSGPQPITAAPTSVVAVLGTTRKGPVLAPTRVTGWADYVRTFGAPTSRGFTGESVFGFFENGGPAAWVIRVDPSTAASWKVFDSSARESFTVSADSPGSWGAALTIGVRPDASGASGAFYRAQTTGATVEVDNGTFTLQVASTTGLRPGDDLVLVPVPASGGVNAPVAATVVSLTPTAIELTTTGQASMAPGSIVASALASTKTTLFLPSGKGFRKGDVVVATAPNGARAGARVTDVVSAGTSVTLTLESAPGAVPGAAFVLRRADFPALATVTGTPSGAPPTTNVPMSVLVFERPLTAPESADLSASLPQRNAARITMPDGRTGAWVNNRFEVVGATPPPSGPVTVNAPVIAVLLADTGLKITNLRAADVSSSYGFLPTEAKVTYTGAGATTVVATRTNAGFNLAPSPDPTHTFTDAGFTLQANADAGIAVRCAVAPRVGDRLAIDTAFAAITDVVPSGADTYVLRFAAGTNVGNLAQKRFGVFAVESAGVAAERFALSVSVDGVVTETFSGLSLSTDHPSYFAKDGVLNGVSTLVTVAPRAAVAPAVSVASAPFYLAPGNIGVDRPATNDDFRAGLGRLEEVDEPAMVICPDAVTVEDPLLQADLVGQVVTHCENFRRFAIWTRRTRTTTSRCSPGATPTWRAPTRRSMRRTCRSSPSTRTRWTGSPRCRRRASWLGSSPAPTGTARGAQGARQRAGDRASSACARAYTQRRQDLLNPGSPSISSGPSLAGAPAVGRSQRHRRHHLALRQRAQAVQHDRDLGRDGPPSGWSSSPTPPRPGSGSRSRWRTSSTSSGEPERSPGPSPSEAYRVRVGLGETMTETDIDLGLVITEVAIAPGQAGRVRRLPLQPQAAVRVTDKEHAMYPMTTLHFAVSWRTRRTVELLRGQRPDDGGRGRRVPRRRRPAVDHPQAARAAASSPTSP